MRGKSCAVILLAAMAVATAMAAPAQILPAVAPAEKAGRLGVEMHPWMVQKGVLP